MRLLLQINGDLDEMYTNLVLNYSADSGGGLGVTHGVVLCVILFCVCLFYLTEA